METKPSTRCNNCPLKDAKGPVWGKGPADARLAVVGQNPGPDEIDCKDQYGNPDPTPFVGTSGRILNRGMFEVGINREKDAFVSNIVKCFVAPGTKVPPKAVECCLPLLRQELDVLHALRVTATLGLEPFNALTGKSLHLQHNRKAAIKDPRYWLRGYPYRSDTRSVRPIIPLEHPASMARKGFLSAPFWQSDWRKVKRWVDGKGLCYEEKTIEDPTEKQVEDYIDKIFDIGMFGLDIETPEQAVEEEELVARAAVPIDVIGLSAEIGECIQVSPPLFHCLDRLFNAPRSTIDMLICYIFNSAFDTFHLSQRWSLENLEIFCVMLAYNLLYSDSRPKDLGMALSVVTDIPYHKNLQKFNPSLYNARDTYGALWGGMELHELLKQNGLEQLFWEHEMPMIPVVEDMRNIGVNCDVSYATKAELTCYKQLEVYDKWWSKAIPLYSWTAPKQLLELFAKMKLPIRYKQRVRAGTKERYKSPCVDEEVLEEYRDKFKSKTAGLVLEMRKLKKAADFTKIYSSDGRSHSQYKIHGQKQGRIQSKAPDLQNIPEEAANIHPRKIIIGDNPGDVIISADFNQIELWLYAYCANDIPFLLAKQKGDYIYGQLYEEIFNEPFFVEGKPRTKKYRADSVPPWKLLIAKSGPLGLIYGRGIGSLMDLGVTRDKAADIYNSFFREHHTIATFHSMLQFQVEKYGFLRNKFGRIRRFPNARGQRNEFLSFPGQSNAGDVLRRNALIPLRTGLKPYHARVVLTVHDQVAVSCPREAVHDCVGYIKQTMEAPIPQLDDFFIPIEVKVGPNWNDVILYDKWCEENK
jgi:uracil-DNA glycosylase family 4